MILQALKEYYDRKAAEPDSEMAPAGFHWRGIPYVIRLEPDGTPVALSATFDGEGKAKRAKSFLVPQPVKKTSGIAANLLWDSPEYALGVVLDSKPDRVRKQHAAFTQRVKDLGEIRDAGLTSILRFLEINDKESVLSEFSTWADLRETRGSVTFELAGDEGIVLERVAVKKAIRKADEAGDAEEQGLCLITGSRQPIVRLHTAIKGLRGARSTGANIVSFNLDAFASFGKKQGANAPVGKSAAFAYTTALNHLLAKNSRQKMLFGDATAVFWAEKPMSLETGIGDILGETPKDDPDRGVRAVESLFRSVETGKFERDKGGDRFYVLGLAPNASRVAIRFWVVDTVAGMARKITQHLQDVKIVHRPRIWGGFFTLPALGVDRDAWQSGQHPA